MNCVSVIVLSFVLYYLYRHYTIDTLICQALFYNFIEIVRGVFSINTVAYHHSRKSSGGTEKISGPISEMTTFISSGYLSFQTALLYKTFLQRQRDRS